MNAVAYFEIQSSDPAREREFYSRIFGWNFIKQPMPGLEYYRIECRGIHGGLLKRPAQSPAAGMGTNAFTCSMQVEDFDFTAKEIAKNGGQVALPKFAIPGRCWQGYFTDPDQNVFGIFEVDERAM